MTNIVSRLVIAAAMLVSGVLHAYLYLHGYQHIPVVGTGFMVQASAFCAVGVLLIVGAPQWFEWASGLLSVGALIAFVMSRTVGLFGFVEQGLDPVPYALLSVVAEAAVVVIVAGAVATRRAARAQ